MKEVWAAIKRFGRGGVAVLAAAAVQYINNSTDPAVLLIAPALMAAGKYLREKCGWTWLPV